MHANAFIAKIREVLVPRILLVLQYWYLLSHNIFKLVTPLKWVLSFAYLRKYCSG